MAKSRFEYVRNYEQPDPLLQNTYIVVRIDGHGFHRFSDTHKFEKPNDKRALDLMDRAAKMVMDDIHDVVMAFGESDEHSFLIRRNSQLFNRRRSKINSTIVSLFTSAYVFYWSQYFPNTPLRYPPSFDSRVVLYPSEREVRDYFGWRQADTHINNLQNTSFWALVKSGLSTKEANKALQGTDSKDKNELLFSKFGINYNNLPPQYRKGSTLVRTSTEAFTSGTISSSSPTPAESSPEAGPPGLSRSASKAADEPDQITTNANSVNRPDSSNIFETDPVQVHSEDQPVHISKQKGKRAKRITPYEGLTGEVVVLHEDIIGDRFWTLRPWLLA